MYIPTHITLGFYRLGFAYSESRSPVQSLCPCPSSAATASASASSPATGTSGEDPFSVAKMGYVFLPICGIGLVVCPTVSGGLLPLRGSCCPASRGRCLRCQTPWFRRCDGCRPSLLACSFIVFKVHWFSDVLLMVPFKLHFFRRCGGRLHGWLRSSATRKTGDSYKDLNVTFVFKFVFVRWVVNYQFYYE